MMCVERGSRTCCCPSAVTGRHREALGAAVLLLAALGYLLPELRLKFTLSANPASPKN